VLSNDSDLDSTDSLSVTSVANGSETAASGESIRGSSGGIFTVNADGSFQFSPGNDFVELSSNEQISTQVTYVVSDSHGASESQTLTITVVGQNQPDDLVTVVIEPTASPTEEEAEQTTEPVAEKEVEVEKEAEEEKVSESEVANVDESTDDQTDSPFLQIGDNNVANEQLNTGLAYIGPGQSALQFLLNDGDDEIRQGKTFDDSYSQIREIIQEREDQLSIIDSSDFFRSISRLRGDIEADEQLTETITSGSLVFSAGLSVGYVIWIARSGILLSSIVSSLPAWRLIDPLPILASLGDGLLEEDDETLESIAAGEAEVEVTGTEATATQIDPPLDH
jgi:VCBS repeat-containing protein